MTFFESIVDIWSSTPAVQDLLSSDRLYSQRSEDRDDDVQLDVPYALVTLISESEDDASSHGEIDEEIYQVSFFFADAVQARECRAAFRAAMRLANRQRRFQHDEGEVVGVTKGGGGRKIEDGGIAHAFDEWRVLVSK